MTDETAVETTGEHVHRPDDPPCQGCGWQPKPHLIHSGVYALYRTPTGGLHVSFRRQRSGSDDGQVHDVDGAQDEHLPDIPAAAVPLVSSFLDHGFPAAILGLLGQLSSDGNGGGGKLAMLRALAGMRGALEQDGEPAGGDDAG